MTESKHEQISSLALEEVTLGQDVLEQHVLGAEPDDHQQFVERLARELAQALGNALRNWQGASGTQRLESAVERQEAWLASTADQVAELDRRVGELARAAAEQKSAALAADDTMSELRLDFRRLESSLCERVDALTRRLGIQEEELADVSAASANLTQRVETAAGRLERQAAAIRGIWTARSQTAEMVQELAQILGRIHGASEAEL
jgi:hypothetical protein